MVGFVPVSIRSAAYLQQEHFVFLVVATQGVLVCVVYGAEKSVVMLVCCVDYWALGDWRH